MIPPKSLLKSGDFLFSTLKYRLFDVLPENVLILIFDENKKLYVNIMPYFLISDTHNEIVFESKRGSIGCAPFFVGGIFLVFILIAYLLIPKNWAPFFFPVIVFDGVVFFYVFRKKNNKSDEFERITFSARNSAIELKGNNTKQQASISYNEIAFFDVLAQTVSTRKTNSSTIINYVYAIRMFLKDNSEWVFCTFKKEEEAAELANRLKAFCIRHQREGINSKGYIPKAIEQTRLGSNTFEFRWSNRNYLSFLFFTFVSIMMIFFFGFIMSQMFQSTSGWIDNLVALVFCFFFILIFLVIQVLEFPKVLKSVLYDYELFIDRKEIRMEGVRKNGKRKVIFQGSVNDEKRFILNHYSSDYMHSDERAILYMTPRISYGQETEIKEIKEYLKSQFEQLRSAQKLSFNPLKLHEVMAFRNYLNEIIDEIRV
jgi:hypothetical protein